jgi:hypothetical protein
MALDKQNSQVQAPDQLVGATTPSLQGMRLILQRYLNQGVIPWPGLGVGVEVLRIDLLTTYGIPLQSSNYPRIVIIELDEGLADLKQLPYYQTSYSAGTFPITNKWEASIDNQRNTISIIFTPGNTDWQVGGNVKAFNYQISIYQQSTNV